MEGKVKKILPSSLKVTIDSKEYEVSKIAPSVYNYSMKLYLGDEGIFFLDHNNRIVGFDVDTVERENYAVVIGIEEGSIVKGRFNSEEIKYYPSIKISTGNGRTEILDIYVEIDRGW